MAVTQDIIATLRQHDFAALADPHIVSVVYFAMFAILFSENGLLSASFLPSDSLLILAGTLIAQGVMDFLSMAAILAAATSLGYWLSYIQGCWLGNTKTVKGWLIQLPAKCHQRATYMFGRHGLLALLVGCLPAFVRMLLPTMAGISGLPNRRFQFFNWLSELLWVSMITSFDYALSTTPFVKHHEDQVATFLMILSAALLAAGLLGMLFVAVKKKYCNAWWFSPFPTAVPGTYLILPHCPYSYRIFPRRRTEITLRLAAELRCAFIADAHRRRAGLYAVMGDHHPCLMQTVIL